MLSIYFMLKKEIFLHRVIITSGMIQEIVFSSDKNVLVMEGERKDQWVAIDVKSLK